MKWHFCFVIMIRNSPVLILLLFQGFFLTPTQPKTLLVFICIQVICLSCLLSSPFLCCLATWEYILSLLYSIAAFTLGVMKAVWNMITCFCFQILASTHYCSSDQSSCLGSNSHAKWTTTYKNIFRKTFLSECGHVGKDSSI